MFTLYTADIIQIILFLGACWGCYQAGKVSATKNIIMFLEKEGIISIEESDE